jgi:N6-adenosine-specific RNA methylase IME4
MGRPPLKSRPMTNAEKQRRYRINVANKAKRSGTKEKQDRRRARLAEIGLPPTDVAVWTEGDPERFSVIYIDPPWEVVTYSDRGKDRGPERHYPTMTIERIRALRIPAADDCVMYCWRTAPHAALAHSALEAWGFAYVSEHIWGKVTAAGAVRTGTGRWNRNAHEVLMVARRGKMPCPAPGTQFPSLILAPVREHSEKPDIFADMIEAMFPNCARLEMFARRPRAGWTSHGNELVEASP